MAFLEPQQQAIQHKLKHGHDIRADLRDDRQSSGRQLPGDYGFALRVVDLPLERLHVSFQGGDAALQHCLLVFVHFRHSCRVVPVMVSVLTTCVTCQGVQAA